MRFLFRNPWNPLISLLFVWTLLQFNPPHSSGQIVSSFSENPDHFINTLEQHFGNQNNDQEALTFLQDLNVKWNSTYYTDSIKINSCIIVDRMLENKMSSIPFFKFYFTSLNNLVSQKKNPTNTLQWQEALLFMLTNSNSRTITSFLRSSNDLFSKKLAYVDRSLKWEVQSEHYQIDFDKDTLKISFPKTDLSCYAKGDSSTIVNTKGVYFPFSKTWKGVGGRLNWDRTNLSSDTVWAELSSYAITLQNSKFSADSVLFNHRSFFEKAILGKLDEQLLSSRRGNKALFPKFTSYEKRWKISHIFNNIDFVGGVVVEGNHLLGFGDELTQATLRFKRNDTVFITLRSRNFFIQENRISSPYASVTIHHKNDSIYHSGLHMNYSDEDDLLSFYRDEHGLTSNPLYDTYHQINMYVEAIYWDMNENRVRFDKALGRAKSSIAQFESFNYFSKDRFDKLQGIDAENPLLSLKHYSDNNSSKIVYFDEYADHLKMPVEQVQLLLLKLAHQGFLIYEANNGRAILGDKIDFYLQAYSGNIDSDIFSLISRPYNSEANAYLEIDNFDLQINGLDKIILSDSQNLIIEPSDRKITLRKNKNFLFDGKITAGRLSLATKHSFFDYDEFKLEMPEIDSLWFWVNGKSLPQGGFKHENIKTALRNLSGDLLIDHPNNKSGKESYEEYPILNSKKDAFVYYDYTHIQNGVYSKEDFYFHVNPFTFSSINNFVTDDVAFEGYLYSGGILPDITQPLKVQEDFSLGFTSVTPDDGLIVYRNKGRIYDTINLSNKGLKGSGRLTFINSSTLSKDFLFLPDSLKSFAQFFELKQSTKPIDLPAISASNILQKWMPYQDSMSLSTTDKLIKMYDDETQMEGTLILQPTSLKGHGDVHFKVAKMSSSNYQFNNQSFDSPKANFKDIGNVLNNFSAHTDYTNRTITFVSNDGTSKVDFPENSYICYMDQATWYMDKEITEYASSLSSDKNQFSHLSLRELAETVYKGSDFISTHPKQDSLSFYSTSAKFNSEKKIIKAEGVHYIKVADAIIFPENNQITILKNAEMIPLENSKIITNAITKYHEINNAKVKIESRKSYTGSGDYIYIGGDSVKHPVHFKEISVNPSSETVARAEIIADDYFPLSPKFYFRGNARLRASRKLLDFDGGFRIADACQTGPSWIKFNSEIDPANVMLPVEIQPITPDINSQYKYIGVLYSQTKQKNYSALLSNKIDYYDALLVSAHGYLLYDRESEEFRVSTKEKLSQNILPDNFFSWNTRDCESYGEGRINLNMKFKDLKFKSYGNVQLKDSAASFLLGAAIDFHFPDNALRFISDQFLSITNTPVDISTANYSKMIAGFLGTEETEQYISKQFLGNLRHVPILLQHTLFLNNLKLKWNSERGAYISKGNFGIENIGKYKVQALVNGNIEFRKTKQGDELTIYFEVGNQWYFFNYLNNVMQVLSSTPEFNAIIKKDMESKGEKNRLKKEKGAIRRSNYRYILCDTKVKDEFLKKYNK